MTTSGEPRRSVTDPTLRDQVDLLAEILRSAARRWRFRADAGRLDAHPLDEVLQLIVVLERAAHDLETASGKVAEPAAADPSQVSIGEELRKSEQRFRLLVDGVRDYAIFMLDPDGRIVSWNAGAERLKGWSADEIVGRHFSCFYVREDVLADKPRRVLELALRDGRFEEESWRVRKDGSVFWADVVLTPIRDDRGNLRGFAKVTRDLTDRKRAQDAMRFLYDATVLLASAFELQKTLHDVAALVVPRMADWCLVDLAEEDGSIRQVAAAHVDPDKVKLARDLARNLPAEADSRRGVAYVIRTGKSEIHPEITSTRWLGELLGSEHPWILRKLGARSYICVPLLARGRVLGAITFVRAAPGYRYGADDLRNADELGRRAGLFIDNARLFEEAQVAIRVRDEFLAIAAHELRTPVTTLQLGIDGIRRMASLPELERLDGRVQAAIELLDRQAIRLATLVEALLDVSHITRGQLKLERTELDLARTVEEMVDRHQPTARQLGSDIRTDLASVVGHWDRAQIQQIVASMLSNAIKYGAGKPIEIKVERREDSAILMIRDHGIGIPRERLSDIFGRFERAVSLRAYGGLGLGLYITRQMVEAHGGSIEVESEPGAGSTFTVELPLGDEDIRDEPRPGALH